MKRRKLDETLVLDPDTDTLPTAFRKRVEKSGPRTALRKKKFGIWQSMTWQEYNKEVKAVAMGLDALNCRRGDKVALISENRPEWVIIDMAILSLGGLTVPIYTTDSANQIQYLVNHSDSRFYFAEDEEQLDKILTVKGSLPTLEKIIVIDMEGLRHFKDAMVMSYDELLTIGRKAYEQQPDLLEERIKQIEPDDLATLVYTSGTTGPPKAAALTHKNSIWSVEHGWKHHPFFASDDIISFLPLSHVGQRTFTVFGALKFGCVTNFVENIDTVPQNLREISPQVLFQVPRMWEKFKAQVETFVDEAASVDRFFYHWAMGVGRKVSKKRSHEESIPAVLKLQYSVANLLVFRPIKQFLGLDRGRILLCGAAPVSPEVLHYFQSLNIDVQEVYGLTETTGIATIPIKRNKIGTVGQAISGVEIRIADNKEILIKGQNVFNGYFKDENATKNVIKDGWFYTGDMGSIDDENYLTVEGRIKHIIITSGGKNISPEYIENEIKCSLYVMDAVVIGEGKKYLTALIVLDEENIVKYAQDHRIPFTTYGSLTQHPEIYKLIEKEIEKSNKKVSRVETIKKFRILDKKLRDEDEELTPTLKVKRNPIIEKYKTLIDSMY
jgi:long-chain acyl-CoA synthetase